MNGGLHTSIRTWIVQTYLPRLLLQGISAWPLCTDFSIGFSGAVTTCGRWVGNTQISASICRSKLPHLVSGSCVLSLPGFSGLSRQWLVYIIQSCVLFFVWGFGVSSGYLCMVLYFPCEWAGFGVSSYESFMLWFTRISTGNVDVVCSWFHTDLHVTCKSITV